MCRRAVSRVDRVPWRGDRLRLFRAPVLWLVVVLTLAGCSGQRPIPVPPPTPSMSAVAVPPGGVSLRELGFEHGPAALITIPESTRLGLRVDQPNMVTMTFLAPDGLVIGSWLGEHLADGGFRVTAESAEGLIFEGYAWSGAFTAHPDGSALTLRRAPAGDR
ncbi:MAG: hypothetical protein Q4G46_10550 [Propionibacteriaceae bacterium]|nr:hypothetical protein [Propionibacteriaceae bacterium]